MRSDALPARPPERGTETADAVRPAGEGLQATLRQIVAASPTPEEALEPALRAILEGIGASAGAICFYDQRAEALRLAAEAGLSDEGCRRLRTVRRGDAMSWDMPLQSLFNRRAYLIESAARNRYVPPLVEQAAAVRMVACLPLYVGATPLGSLVLVTLAPQCFAERHIRILDLPLRELTRLIETVRQRPVAGAAPPSPSAPAPPARGEDVEGLRAALEAERALAVEREEALVRARERIAALEAEATTTGARLVQVVEEAEARARAAADTFTARITELTAECERLRGAITPPDGRSAPDGAVAVEPAAVDAPVPVAAKPVIVVLDVDPVWETVAVNGHRVVVQRPEDASGGSAGPLLANLAAAGALEALVGLRAVGRDERIWGCIADTAGGRALPLGPIEPAARPLDLDAMLASLAAHVARGARVVTVGTDVDVLVSLRQALARQGVSVSMAWDGKQAADLLAMVRPEVVVLDLSLPQHEGCRILARLGAAEPVPTVLVVSGDDDAAGFAAVLADPAYAHALVPLERIVDRLVGHPAVPDTRPPPRGPS